MRNKKILPKRVTETELKLKRKGYNYDKWWVEWNLGLREIEKDIKTFNLFIEMMRSSSTVLDKKLVLFQKTEIKAPGLDHFDNR